MTDKANERVLVVPTARLHALGYFQGLTREVSRYLPALLDPAYLQFLPRSQAESDPNFKQLIPYVVLRHENQVYSYRRGAGGNEARLRRLRSLGIGGHICFEDCGSSQDPYRTGLLREVEEEVYLQTPYVEQILALINDDETAVGQVHLGIVHLFELESSAVQRRDPALVEDGFAPLQQLRAGSAEFESWSQILLEEGCLER